MAQITIEQAMQLALQKHGAGNLAEAEEIYRQVLALQPRHPDALHLLGLIAYHAGQLDIAIDLIRKAIAIEPGNPDYHSNLGSVLLDKGLVDQAIASCGESVRLNPDSAEFHNNLGDALREKGLCDEAILACRQAIQLKPDLAEAHNNLGLALRDNGLIDPAIAEFRQAILSMPGLAEAHSNLGNALADLGQVDGAIASCQEAIRLRPDFFAAYINLGKALYDKGQLDQALGVLQESSKLKPDRAEAHSHRGNVLRAQGLLDESLAAYRKALELNPDFSAGHSNLLHSLHFHPDYDSAAILHEHREWDRIHAQPLRRFIQPHTNDPSPERRLRIGYVSPDLRQHSVGRFLLPLLESHDGHFVEVYCYSDGIVKDSMTKRLHCHTHIWRDTLGHSHEQLSQLIHQDRIDILVDLSMHSAHNRLLTFVRKPAPVQVTYLSYCSTTGLQTIDYRLTDPYLDPPGSGDEYYSERSVRLPNSFWCYQALPSMPEVGRLPAISSGHITFGCLNNFGKVTPTALRTWCSILREVPGSRLVLHSKEGSHRQRVRDLVASEGIDADRLEFIAYLSDRNFFPIYHRIDITLDPFPCAGGTTTCDALWMGVPVVTLKGRTAIGRAGVSILGNIGLQEWIAQTPEQYIRIAIDLAKDLQKLATFRSTMRDRMRQSPLMDADRFARNIETAYRRMWREWCKKQVGGDSAELDRIP